MRHVPPVPDRPGSQHATRVQCTRSKPSRSYFSHSLPIRQTLRVCGQRVPCFRVWAALANPDPPRAAKRYTHLELFCMFAPISQNAAHVKVSAPLVLWVGPLVMEMLLCLTSHSRFRLPYVGPSRKLTKHRQVYTLRAVWPPDATHALVSERALPDTVPNATHAVVLTGPGRHTLRVQWFPQMRVGHAHDRLQNHPETLSTAHLGHQTLRIQCFPHTAAPGGTKPQSRKTIVHRQGGPNIRIVWNTNVNIQHAMLDSMCQSSRLIRLI